MQPRNLTTEGTYDHVCFVSQHYHHPPPLLSQREALWDTLQNWLNVHHQPMGPQYNWVFWFRGINILHRKGQTLGYLADCTI